MNAPVGFGAIIPGSKTNTLWTTGTLAHPWRKMHPTPHPTWRPSPAPTQKKEKLVKVNREGTIGQENSFLGLRVTEAWWQKSLGGASLVGFSRAERRAQFNGIYPGGREGRGASERWPCPKDKELGPCAGFPWLSVAFRCTNTCSPELRAAPPGGCPEG